jgi:hypothetical protein
VKWGAKIIVSGTGITWDSRGSYVDIEGFDISGSGRHGILAAGANLTMTNNFIHDLTISGGCNGTGNYRLSSSSPAIDRGTSTSAPRIDLMMVARPRGAAIDIGAYEF